MIKTNKIDLIKYKNQLDVSEPMAQILLSLNIDFDAAKALLQDPTDLFEINDKIYGQKDVVTFLSALSKNTVINIFADYDVDGLMSGYIAKHFFDSVGFITTIHYPSREEGYGLNIAYAEKIAKVSKDNNIVLCVDNGITANQPIAYLEEHNVPVIVIDHHEPSDKLPEASAICDAWIDEGYGTHLCAAAVMWKTIIAYGMMNGCSPEEINDIMTRYLPFVALATISDVMPPNNENRAIVQAGLKAIDAGQSTVINTLMTVENIEHMRTKDIAWTIAPELNACSRMDNIALAERLIFKEGEDGDDIKDTARAVKEINRKRKKVTEEACYEILNNNDFSEDIICFADCTKYPLGIIGIIAGKITEATGKPAVAYQEKDGIGYGSARAPQGINVKDLINFESQQGNAVGAMGHAEACGVQIIPERIKDLNQHLIESGTVIETNIESGIEALVYNAVITPDDMNYNIRREINSFGYTSKEIPTLGILDIDVTPIAWETSSGKRHLILNMKDSKGKDKYAVMWNGLDYYEEIGCPKKVNIAGTLDNGSFCRYFKGARIGEHSTILTIDNIEDAKVI